jgi:gas vesicle protein
MKTTSKVLIALGAGLAAGAIAGILMAPKKGSETRNLLRKKGVRLVEDVKDNIKHRIDEKNNQFTNLKDDVRDKVNGLNKKIQEVI